MQYDGEHVVETVSALSDISHNCSRRASKVLMLLRSHSTAIIVLTMTDPHVREFVEEKLPLLARHYHRDALNELESRSKWLKAFTSRQSDFEDARNHFFKDGSGCVYDLENHIELTRLARANEALTRLLGSVYSLILAKVHTLFVPLPSEIKKKLPTVEQVFEKDAEIEEMRDRIVEVDNFEQESSRDFLHSFLAAGQATITSDGENEKISL